MLTYTEIESMIINEVEPTLAENCRNYMASQPERCKQLCSDVIFRRCVCDARFAGCKFEYGPDMFMVAGETYMMKLKIEFEGTVHEIPCCKM